LAWFDDDVMQSRDPDQNNNNDQRQNNEVDRGHGRKFLKQVLLNLIGMPNNGTGH